MKSFALIGAAGYIAPRHMKAIQDTGNKLVAAYDPSDSVGIIDSYFPEAAFFTEFERFDRHLDKLRRRGDGVDYVSICSPNYLHDSHMRFGMRSGADVICEKPLVLNPWNLDSLKEIEESTQRKVNTILQLRLHPAVLELKESLASRSEGKSTVELTYITSRGNWYLQSWKGDERKSGGIATNIGVHFFDLLGFLFGSVQSVEVHLREATKASGYIEYERARVRWYLSLDVADVPEKQRASGMRTYRSINVDGNEVELSGGFGDLHTICYEHILSGNGFGVDSNKSAISVVSEIRECKVVNGGDHRHPFLSY